MKRFIVSTICTAAMLVPALALAQGKGGGPKPKATTGVAKQGGGAAHGGAKTQVTSRAVQGGGKTRTATTAASTRGGGHVKTTTTATAKGPKTKATTTTASSANSKSTKETRRSTTTATTTTTTPTGTTLTPVQQKLQKNTNLASKLQSRLPAGTDLNAAADGFRNLGQFVAAVNVSNNLGLDFTQLKTAMVTDGMSLGQAIQDQKKSLDGTTVARRAETDADVLIRASESTAGTTVKTKTKTTKDDRR